MAKALTLNFLKTFQSLAHQSSILDELHIYVSIVYHKEKYGLTPSIPSVPLIGYVAFDVGPVYHTETGSWMMHSKGVLDQWRWYLVMLGYQCHSKISTTFIELNLQHCLYCNRPAFDL